MPDLGCVMLTIGCEDDNGDEILLHGSGGMGVGGHYDYLIPEVLN